jgi:hypothetical protein
VRRRLGGFVLAGDHHRVQRRRPVWAVVQIAELVRNSEELLLRALRQLDPDVRADMPDDAAWVLSGEEADELRGLLCEHRDIAEQMHMLADRIPEHGLTATYADVRDGAADALAEGILDLALLTMATRALDTRAGWTALGESLTSTDVRTSWTDLDVDQLLGSFRDVDRRLVRRVLEMAQLAPDARLDQLTDAQAQQLGDILRTAASRT